MLTKRKNMYHNHARMHYCALHYDKLNPAYVLLIASLALVTFMLPFIQSHTAFAATRTWDGGGADTNWSTCANWSSDTCPTAADDVVFDVTAGASTLSASTTIR